MPRFTVTVTRDTTESATIEMEADTEEEAAEKAIGFSYDNPHVEWFQDDTPNASSDHYVTGVEPSE